MSIIGTRPPLISETSLYELHHRARLAIKPGITGMWQVSGRSDITDFEEVVRLDKEYIENWNIGMDIKILLKTVLVVFKKDGSMLWEAYELDLEKLLDYPVWYADYEEFPQTPYRFSMWQYSSTGSVAGIEGNVDLNIQLLKK